ncbi:hypothetical protein NDR87_22250 [Nocardia sp. CDC159]|uniref:Phthiocerol/phthiodiolone dimycocerosyl transferase n=1 Tax=Nocardia pulmonis TaxID=2951408 RepID=A0A9X2EEH3_9NOCA|nr:MULTISPECIES: hypothetical protein [Nocardia]MCM6776758.1 hypothetical protein [Nocardia pulmonis]MCM6789093.1 hypothetical protein [Nocardia sp. CDC159]
MGSSPTTLIRPLAPSEATFATFGIYVGYATLVRGRLDTTALMEAFRALQRAYPVLASRIADDSGRSVLERADGAGAISRCERNSGDPLAGLPDPRSRAALVHIAPDDCDQTWVTLLTHHSIADGHHALQLLADLWALYTDIVEGREIWTNRHGYPRPAEQLLAERGVTGDPGEPMDWSTQLGQHPDPAPPSTPATVRTRLTAAETKALIAFGHRENTTINGLVSAALLRAEAEVRGVGVGGLTYRYVVDLRTRVDPPMGYTDGTNVLGLATFVADADAYPGIAHLARAINDEFARDLASGTIQRSALRLPEQFAASGDVDVQSTNWGRIPPLRTPSDASIEDFRPLGHTVGASLASGGWPRAMHIITTFAGQLTIDSEVTGSPTTDRIRALLTELPG